MTPPEYPSINHLKHKEINLSITGSPDQTMLAAVRLLLLSVVIAISSFAATPAMAQGPENTIVVVNAESADSLAVANLYISLRDIPATNVVYLTGIKNPTSDLETSDSKYFLKQIWNVVSSKIEERGLSDQINCVTYSAGFPTRLNAQTQLNSYLLETGKKYSVYQQRPWMSISSMTYLHDIMVSRGRTFLESDANRYAKLKPGFVLRNPFNGEASKQYTAAEQAVKISDYSKAVRILEKLVEKHPYQVPVIYALARASALNGDVETAIQLLEDARSKGFAYRSLVKNDPCFTDIKNNADFKSILSNMEDLSDGVLPTRGFLGNSYWAKNGWPCSTPEQGNRYLLSTVLAVTGKNQSTLKQALAQIERSVKADGTKPEGNVYFAKHSDPRSTTRQAQFDFAASELKTLQRSAIITSKRIPVNDSRVVGATLGSPSINWSSARSRFVPGALCDNFTSYGGWWAKTKQTQLSEYLNAGAAGASGTVCEPYTIPWKIPNARLHAHYARGATLAEAFYQSVSGPFQLLIVGDPLCCPFGDFPKFQVTGLEQNAIIQSNFTLQIKADSKSPKIRHYEIYYDGVITAKVEKPEKIKIAIDAMSDGFHELRLVGVADTPTANRTSEQFGFVIDRNKQNVSLNVTSKKVPIDRKLKLTSTVTTGGKIQIRQNSRIVASITSGATIEIDASKLGLGETQLTAVTTTPDGSVIASSPLTVEITQ